MVYENEFKSPEVSVVISCYNSARWLSAAIDSVLIQSYSDFELILIDDGSTDHTKQIIEMYQEMDRRVVSIFKSNTGLTDSLNVGLLKARGTWIARLDADDLCEKDRLQEQVNFIKKNSNTVLLGAGFTEIDENGCFVKVHKYKNNHNLLLNDLLQFKNSFPHSSVFFNRDLVLRLGGYNSYLKKSQDYDLWIRISEYGNIACLPKPLVKIRKHGEQISTSSVGFSQGVYAVASGVCYYLRKQKVPDPSKAIISKDWDLFLDWISIQDETSDYFNLRQSLIEGRTRYYSCKYKFVGILFLLYELIRSRSFGKALWIKLFGTSISKVLSKRWACRHELS